MLTLPILSVHAGHVGPKSSLFLQQYSSAASSFVFHTSLFQLVASFSVVCFLFRVWFNIDNEFDIVFSGGCDQERAQEAPWRIHTLFSVACQNYFNWPHEQLQEARQLGSITRRPNCMDEEKKNYRGMDLAPTLEIEQTPLVLV